MASSSSSSATTTTNHGSSWVSQLSINEMKQILKNTPESKTCIERSDLESLILSKYQSMEDFKLSMEDESKLLITKRKIQNILSQDRGVLNFEHYKPSKVHQDRMKQLKQVAPELYDNPSITPRSKWFNHPRYRQNSQMPPFHVHFRHEMQQVLTYLYQAYSTSDTSNQMMKNIRNASSTFHGSMRGLQGHVSIEEYACFPTYKDLYPHVDIKFLYTDHQHLHDAEQNVSDSLTRLVDCQGNEADVKTVSRSQILDTLELFLSFDDLLMAHLGEEEEIVVPMSLTDKDLFF